MYGAASRVSQSRGFHPKNWKKKISQISSESSKTYRKSLLKCFWIFFEKNIHLRLGKISKFSRFSLDIATLDHHCSQTRNPMTKWLGTVVHIYTRRETTTIVQSTISPPLWLQEGVSLQPLRFCNWYIFNQKPINWLALWPSLAGQLISCT